MFKIKTGLAERWGPLKTEGLPDNHYNLDYAVIDNNNQVVGVTRNHLDTDLVSAERNRDTVVDIKSGNILLGKLIIYNNTFTLWEIAKVELFMFSLFVFVLTGMVNLIYSYYLKKT